MTFRVLGFLTLFLVVSFTTSAQTVVDGSLYEVDTGLSVNQLDWSSDGQFIAVASSPGFTIFTPSLEPVANLYPDDAINAATWNPVGNQFALTHHQDVEIWNWNSEKQSLEYVTSLQYENLPFAIFWSPDGTRLVTLVPTHFEGYEVLAQIVVWDTATWQQTLVVPDQYLFDTQYSTAHIMDWSPNGEPLIVGVGYAAHLENDLAFTDTKLVAYIINVDTGERVQEIPLRGPYALSVAWHPDDDVIAVGGALAAALYDRLTGNFTDSICAGFDTEALAWSADGHFLMCKGEVADFAHDNKYLGFFRNDTPPRTVGWSPDGKQLAIGTTDGEVKIVELQALIEAGSQNKQFSILVCRKCRFR